jgi:hypothetical protein
MMGWTKGQRWSKVHRGEIDLGGLADDIMNQIDATIPTLQSGIDTLINTQTMELSAKPSEVIAQVALNHKLTTGQKSQATDVLSQYADHESGFRNLFGIVNAVTRAAQIQKQSADQFYLEEIGGALAQMDKATWARFNNAAQSLDPEKVNKVYGVVAV